jgi:FAD/FMN-containing dehydrogenase
MATVLPVGVSSGAIDDALRAFVDALGDDAVLTSPEEVAEFRDPYDFKGSDEYTGSAVVMPTTTEEVQAIVRIANEFKVPLWTHSQGRNNTYGGAAPRLRGSIIVSLRRMNRVLEVNEDLAYCVVEPGVRFFDLYDHFEENGYKLWLSNPDLGWGSVIGNILDCGRGYTPHGDHASQIHGMEVVLPNGELLRTGMGAMTDSPSWHTYKWSFGPSHDGLFLQSNLGIVTKMGVSLMRAPEVYVSAWAILESDAQIAPVTEAVRELMFEGIIRNFPLFAEGSALWDGNNTRTGGAGSWSLRFALYGRDALVEAEFEIVQKAFSRIPGVEVGRQTFRNGEHKQATNRNDRVQSGVPDLMLLETFKQSFGEHAGHLDLSPIVPLTGDDMVASIAQMRVLHEKYDRPYYGLFLIMRRSALHITSVVCDTTDEESTRAAYEDYKKFVVDLAKTGHPIYRTNLQSMDLVADSFDFNDHAQLRLNEQLKDLLDPNGILSPGKSGIWPKAMREERRRTGTG